ncbi:MAG: AhpC/TSA family protein [Bacteroidetes bacterium]|nr:AhpC/TSA family protein [Bacteroidota bacterium]
MKTKYQLLFLISCCLLLFYSCGNNNENSNYQIKGNLTNSNGEFVSLVDVNSSEIKTIDSVKVNEKGEFTFIKKVPEKGFYSIQISSSNYATIIADSTENISFEGDAKNLNEGYKVTGSKDSETLLHFNDFTKKNFKKMESSRMKQDSLRRVYEAYLNTTPDSLFLDSISKMLEPVFNSFSEDYRKLADETNEYIRNFVNENTSSFASLAAVQMLSPDKDIAYFIKVSDALTAKYPNVENLKGFKKYVDSKKKLAVGSLAPEITLDDKDGKSISLSSLKGKIVIVDFWASWCKPCRAENPFMVLLYNKYKDKGLDIFSVSLDFKKEAWLEAISKDKLSWKNHVSDLKQWQSSVVSQYGFEAIPFTCLLDKEGNIAGKNLRGPELEEKIKELLGISQ